MIMPPDTPDTLSIGDLRVMYDYDRRVAKEVGRQTFGPFDVEYLPQHAWAVPAIGEALLESERRCAAAGYRIRHEIHTLITGRGAAKALALYYAQSPPTMKIAPKSFNRANLVHTLVHELGHYFHDKTVPGGFKNNDVSSKYFWALRQKRVGEGSTLDIIHEQIKDLREKAKETQEEKNRLAVKVWAPPKKGSKVEFDYNWFGRKFRAVGIVGKKRGKMDVEVEILDPPELQSLVRQTYRGNVLPVGLSTLSSASPTDLAKLQELEAQRMKYESEANELAVKAQGIDKADQDNRYEEQFHDWLPTTYSKKNVMEWFAELFVTDVLGHLKPAPSEWVKSMIHTGKPPA